MWNQQVQRCEYQYQGLLGQLDEGFVLEGDENYFELPYTEPVYEPAYEPVYQAPEPVYFAPEPAAYVEPYTAPEPIYFEPEPVYQPVYEPAPVFEPIPVVYTEPVYDQPAYVEPYIESRYVEPEIFQQPFQPVYEPTFEPTPFIPPIEAMAYQAPEPVYVEPAIPPEPISYFEPEPIIEEFFALPYIEPEPEPIVYEPAPAFEPLPMVELVEQGIAPSFTSLPYVEPVSIFESVAQFVPEPEPVFFELPYVEPEPIEEEQIFFELPPPPESLPAPTPTYSDWVFCAPEWGRCEFPDTREVRYGKETTWTAPRLVTGGIDCTNTVWGDPIKGTVKECQTRAVVSQPAPEPVPIPAPITEPELITEQFFELPVAPIVEPEPEPITQWPAEPDWPITPLPEPVTVIGVDKSMYTDDFGSIVDSGFYEPSVGGDSFAIDYASVYEPIDFAPSEPILFEPEPLPFEPLPGEFEFFPLPEPPIEEISFGEFDFGPLIPPTLEPIPEPVTSGIDMGSDLFQESLFDWLATGLDFESAVNFATLDVEAAAGPDVIRIAGAEEGAQGPIVLPELLSPTPFIPTPIEPFEFFQLPFVPFEEPLLPPPAPKLGPCNTPTGLPGVCAQGFYHPVSSPCDCVPFPPAPTSSQAPKPPTQQPAPAPKPPTTQAPKPPTQQQACPTTHCKHPQTGQCMLIPVGYQRHPQTQVCTPITAQASQLPPSVSGALDQLKKIPWWVWAAGAGLLLLSQSGGDRTTTVRYRRA